MRRKYERHIIIHISYMDSGYVSKNQPITQAHPAIEIWPGVVFIGVGHANGRCLEDECKRLCHEEMRERTRRDLRTPHDPLQHGPIADATNAIVTLIHHQI